MNSADTLRKTIRDNYEKALNNGLETGVLNLDKKSIDGIMGMGSIPTPEIQQPVVEVPVVEEPEAEIPAVEAPEIKVLGKAPEPRVIESDSSKPNKLDTLMRRVIFESHFDLVEPAGKEDPLTIYSRELDFLTDIKEAFKRMLPTITDEQAETLKESWDSLSADLVFLRDKLYKYSRPSSDK